MKKAEEMKAQDFRVIEVLIGICIAVAGYIGTQISGLNANMSELNAKIALLLERTTTHDQALKQHDERLRNVEKRIK